MLSASGVIRNRNYSYSDSVLASLIPSLPIHSVADGTSTSLGATAPPPTANPVTYVPTRPLRSPRPRIYPPPPQPSPPRLLSVTQTAKYFFLRPSKQLYLLAALALAHEAVTRRVRARGWTCREARQASADVLNDWNPTMTDHTASFNAAYQLRAPRVVGTGEVHVLGIGG